MCSFDYHFHRAMEYEDDLVWIMAVYYNLMRAIMPNQFGLDHFDFADAYGEQKEHLCSKDLREFVEKEKREAENKENNK